MKHIVICICTYKRPAMLNRLIASLKEQETDGSFRISITVVDNDREGSAAEIVAKIEKGCSLPIHYVIEPRQNISLARNRALTSTEADYYACIDDDEFADKVWLLNHYKTIVRHRAAGVLGPVDEFKAGRHDGFLKVADGRGEGFGLRLSDQFFQLGAGAPVLDDVIGEILMGFIGLVV